MFRAERGRVSYGQLSDPTDALFSDRNFGRQCEIEMSGARKRKSLAADARDRSLYVEEDRASVSYHRANAPRYRPFLRKAKRGGVPHFRLSAQKRDRVRKGGRFRRRRENFAQPPSIIREANSVVTPRDLRSTDYGLRAPPRQTARLTNDVESTRRSVLGNPRATKGCRIAASKS